MKRDPLVLRSSVDVDFGLVQEKLDNLLMTLLHRQMERTPVILVLKRVVDALLQQELGHRGMPFERSQVETVAPAVDGLVDFPAPRDEEPHDLVIAMLAGHVQRCPLLCVLGRNVRSVLKQIGGHLSSAFEDGVVQRGAAVVGPHVCVHPLAVPREEQCHDFKVTLLGSEMERGPAVPVSRRHQLGAVSCIDDVLDALQVAVEGGSMDRIASRLAGEGKVGRVGADHLDNVGVALLRGKDDCRPAVLVLHVDIHLILEEDLGHLHKPFEGSEVESRPSDLYSVVGVCSLLDETPGYSSVAVVAGKVEGCPALVVLDADEIPGLEAAEEGIDQLQGPAARGLLEGGGP